MVVTGGVLWQNFFSVFFYKGKLKSQVILMTGTQPTGTQLEWFDSRPRFLLWFSHWQLRNEIFDLPMLQAMFFHGKGSGENQRRNLGWGSGFNQAYANRDFWHKHKYHDPPRIDNTILYTRRWRQRPSQKADYGGVLSTMYQLDGWGVPQYEKDTAMGTTSNFLPAGCVLAAWPPPQGSSEVIQDSWTKIHIFQLMVWVGGLGF